MKRKTKADSLKANAAKNKVAKKIAKPKTTIDAPPEAGGRDGPQKLDERWLKHHLELNQLSQRRMAKILGLKPTAITKLLVGTRRLQIDEALALSKLFNVTLDEVLFAAGIRGVAKRPGQSAVEVEGYLDGHLNLHSGSSFGPKRVPNPLPLEQQGEGVVAVRFQTSGSAYEALDGTLVYYREQKGVFHPEALGRLCMVSLAGSGERKLRIIKKGYRAASYNLFGFRGEPMEQDSKVKEAWPVLWIKL